MRGKKFSKTLKDPRTGRTRTVRYGEAGSSIRPGTSKGDAYCARSAKIKGDWKSDPNSPNNLSRRKWKCRGSKSMRESVSEARTPFAYKAVIVAGTRPVPPHVFRGSGLRHVTREDAFDHYEGRHKGGPRLFKHHTDRRSGVVIDAHGAKPEHIAKLRDELTAQGYDSSLLYMHSPLASVLKRNAYSRKRVLNPHSLANSWHRSNRARQMLRDHFGDGAYREFDYSKFTRSPKHKEMHGHVGRIAREMVDRPLANTHGRSEVSQLAATVKNPKRLIYVGRTPDGKRPLHPAQAIVPPLLRLPAMPAKSRPAKGKAAKRRKVNETTTSGGVGGLVDGPLVTTGGGATAAAANAFVRDLIAQLRAMSQGKTPVKSILPFDPRKSLREAVAVPSLSTKAYTPSAPGSPTAVQTHLMNGRVVEIDGTPYIVRSFRRLPHPEGLQFVEVVGADFYGRRHTFEVVG